jgi:hypothetical protein
MRSTLATPYHLIKIYVTDQYVSKNFQRNIEKNDQIESSFRQLVMLQIIL